jgi:hypothetical protein
LVYKGQRDVLDIGNTDGNLGYIGCIKVLSVGLDIKTANCEKPSAMQKQICMPFDSGNKYLL